eukprot:TRINITY_DN30411_c0_g1_i1.p1 TRINITY_DN30411_c0_g1~~TRINITY_DN30411_c0_g1_i1.p1  ORF type:complete len:311 (-),score=93.98 TRINITY_DN30411_c0_g1_i1:442-1374(-)
MMETPPIKTRVGFDYTPEISNQGVIDLTPSYFGVKHSTSLQEHLLQEQLDTQKEALDGENEEEQETLTIVRSRKSGKLVVKAGKSRDKEEKERKAKVKTSEKFFKDERQKRIKMAPNEGEGDSDEEGHHHHHHHHSYGRRRKKEGNIQSDSDSEEYYEPEIVPSLKEDENKRLGTLKKKENVTENHNGPSTTKERGEELVRLNIGGTYITTTKSTLLSKGENFFTPLLEGKLQSQKDETGAYFIDRNGQYFEPILNFLRYGQLIVPTGLKLLSVLQEANFYSIDVVPGMCGVIKEGMYTRKQWYQRRVRE